MSMIQAFSLLKDVKPYKQGWRVQVKLLHSWRQKTNYGGDTLEMIFTDETVRLFLYVLCSVLVYVYVLYDLNNYVYVLSFMIHFVSGC